MKAFAITTHAASADSRLGIEINDRIYVGRLNWSTGLGDAVWFASRPQAIEYLFSIDYAAERSILWDRLVTGVDWLIIEITYDTRMTEVQAEERDAVIRRNAIERLSQDERRVLGLDS